LEWKMMWMNTECITTWSWLRIYYFDDSRRTAVQSFLDAAGGAGDFESEDLDGHGRWLL
jgi:hypothetical protein